MARYWAEIDKDNIVKRVIVCDDPDWPAKTLGGTWVETYMDKPDTHNYAGIGYKFETDKVNFSSPKLYPSWSLDEKAQWQPPVKMPDAKEGVMYQWDEATTSWKEVVK